MYIPIQYGDLLDLILLPRISQPNHSLIEKAESHWLYCVCMMSRRSCTTKSVSEVSTIYAVHSAYDWTSCFWSSCKRVLIDKRIGINPLDWIFFLSGKTEITDPFKVVFWVYFKKLNFKISLKRSCLLLTSSSDILGASQKLTPGNKPFSDSLRRAFIAASTLWGFSGCECCSSSMWRVQSSWWKTTVLALLEALMSATSFKAVDFEDKYWYFWLVLRRSKWDKARTEVENRTLNNIMRKTSSQAHNSDPRFQVYWQVHGLDWPL